MLNQENFKKGLTVLFSIHGQLEPKENKELVYRAWYAMLKDIPNQAFLNAITKFVLETKKLFPGDNWIAQVREIASPKLQETEGDCLELAFEAVSRFGYMEERKAMSWLKEKSPLVAAAVRRFGFGELCKSEKTEVARGQLRAIFKTEKERSIKAGGVVESAKDLDQGIPKKLLDLGKNIGNGGKKALPEKDAA